METPVDRQNHSRQNHSKNSKTEKSADPNRRNRSKRFHNSKIRDEHVLVSIGMAPLRWTQTGYRHLSSVKGFGIVATIMSAYCAGLSVEAIYIATPSVFIEQGEYTEESRRSRRFIPKPYVNDGAELGRINPLPNLQRAVLQRYFSWLPYWIKGGAIGSYRTIWDEPAILFLSVIGAVVIQRFEALIWRKKSVSTTRAEFYQANSTKVVKADSDAIALAHYKANQHNRQGTGSMLGTFLAVVMLYGLEIGAFLGSFSGGVGWVIHSIYGFLTIAGFEVFDRMADDCEEE